MLNESSEKNACSQKLCVITVYLSHKGCLLRDVVSIRDRNKDKVVIGFRLVPTWITSSFDETSGRTYTTSKFAKNKVKSPRCVFVYVFRCFVYVQLLKYTTPDNKNCNCPQKMATPKDKISYHTTGTFRELKRW